MIFQLNAFYENLKFSKSLVMNKQKKCIKLENEEDHRVVRRMKGRCTGPN